MSKRTNEEWLHNLKSNGPKYDQAILDLREILLSGLRRGLLSRVNTSAPEFATQAEDFVQEALLKILDNLHTFAGRSQFTTWAHKITLSVALTELRRKRWQDTSLNAITETDSGVYTPSFTADPRPSPEKAAAQGEMLHHINNLIQKELTEKQHTALTASILQGLSTKQVAQMMDMKPNAVYKLLHDARVKLKKRLAQDGLSPADVIAAFE